MTLATSSKTDGSSSQIADPLNHITHTRYFKLEDTSQQLRPPLRLELFRWLRQLLERKFGIKIVRSTTGKRIEKLNYSRNVSLETIWVERLAQFLESFFSTIGLKPNYPDLEQWIRQYDEIIRSSEISNLEGGMGYNNGLVTYCFCRIAAPNSAVESGVWRGFTTYLLDQATSGKCQIFAFDISFSKIEYKSKKARYFENDISNISLKLPDGPSLALFDDHVAHYDRILTSMELGIDFLILDDDVSVETVHSDGWPPIPTANMIMRYQQIPHDFDWVSQGRTGHADISGLDAKPIQDAFAYATLPDLFEFTGYQNSSVTSFLVRKN